MARLLHGYFHQLGGIISRDLATRRVGNRRLVQERLSEENFGLLEQLRGLGVKVVLDDFGSGYASLGYLREFPFHEINIDQTFVADDSLQAYAILDSVTHLGHALGACVTAEGVETQERLDRVREIACDKAQGFLLGRPMPASDVDNFLQQNNAPNITRHRSALRTGAFRTMKPPVHQTRLSGIYRQPAGTGYR